MISHKFKNNIVYHIASCGVDIHHNEKIWCLLCDHIINEVKN